MTSGKPNAAGAPIEMAVFDGWRSLTAAVYLAIVGYGVLVGIPVISTAWVTLLGFTETQVGRVAGADLGGLSIGSVIAAMLAAKMNRQLLVFIAIGITVAANLLCLLTVDYAPVLLLRLLAGIGSGIYTGVAVATLGATSKPARALNLLLFVFAFSQALEMKFLPMLSMNGIYWVFIVCNLIGLPLLRWLPARPAQIDPTLLESGLADSARGSGKGGEGAPGLLAGVPRRAPWLVLIAVGFSYINIGAYWTYIELASQASPDADPQWVSQSLVWASFCSIVGCLVATVISDRFGLARPLLVTMFCHAIIVGMLAFGITDANIFISLFSFNFLWIFIDVYQMATIANVDKTGRYVALVPGAQGFGQIIGPNIAASLLALNMGYAPVFIMCGAASLVGMFIYAYMYVGLRRDIPALADAS
jgi:predicted MFS family arabinose efflux permease